MTGTIIKATLGGLLGAGILAPLIYRLLLKTNSRQKISEHVPEHAAKQGTPTMGGLIIVAGVLAGMLATWNPGYLPGFVLLLGFGIAGFLDDYVVPKMAVGKRGLGWKQKLLLEFGAVGLAVYFSGQTSALYVASAVFLVLFFSNAYNFSDGLDTLSGGLGVLICAGLIGLDYIWSRNAPSTPLLAAMAGAFLPFLLYNAPPAKVFMGDVGALPLGALMGWQVLELGAPKSQPYDLTVWPILIVLSLVMIAELVPVPLQVGSAKLRKGRRLFPFRTPVHHGFQHAGWPETRVVWMFHIVQAICVLAALSWAWIARNGI